MMTAHMTTAQRIIGEALGKARALTQSRERAAAERRAESRKAIDLVTAGIPLKIVTYSTVSTIRHPENMRVHADGGLLVRVGRGRGRWEYFSVGSHLGNAIKRAEASRAAGPREET